MFHTGRKISSSICLTPPNNQTPTLPPAGRRRYEEQMGEKTEDRFENVLGLLKRFQKLNRLEFVHIIPPVLLLSELKKKRGGLCDFCMRVNHSFHINDTSS